MSYSCAYILNSIIQFISQVCQSRPVGSQVQGCVRAHSITYITSIYAYVIDLCIDEVFLSRGVLFCTRKFLADSCLNFCTRLIYMFLLMDVFCLFLVGI